MTHTKRITLITLATILLTPTPTHAHPIYTKHHVDYHMSRYQQTISAQAKTNRTWRSRAKAQTWLAQRLIPWRNLKACETKGYPGWQGWRYNGSSGFDGGLQFDPRTWRAYGGRTFTPYAYQATPIQQIAIAQKVLKAQGRSAWPHCTSIGAW